MLTTINYMVINKQFAAYLFDIALMTAGLLLDYIIYQWSNIDKEE